MERTFNDYLSDVFFKVFIGLLITTAVAFGVYRFGLYENSTLIYGSLIVEFICVLVFTFTFRKLPKSIVYLLYLFYCALTGVAFSIYPLIYDGGSIILAITITTALFLSLAVYGHFTKRDLSKISTYLFFGLIGIIVSSIINLFLGNPMMDLIISCATIIIFMGYTAFDTQKLFEYYRWEKDGYDENYSIYGAFQLYLDYINLFIEILKIIGSSKDDD